MSSASMITAGAPLSGVLASIDPSVAIAVTPVPDEVFVRDVVLWDALEPLTPSPAGLLLLLGAGPSHPMITETMASAARTGHGVVAMKVRGARSSAAAAAANEAGLVLLAVADEVPWSTVQALLAAAVSAHGGDSGLGERATNDLAELADAVATRIDAAITIEDAERHVLAYSNVAGQPIDASRQGSILGRHVPDVPERLSEYRQLARSSGPVSFPSHADTLARVVMPVRVGGRLLGSIWAIDVGGDQFDRLGVQLAAIAPQVALHLLRTSNRNDLERFRRSELLALQLSPSQANAAEQVWATRPQLPVALIGFGPVRGTNDVLDEHRLTTMIALTVEASCHDAWCAQVDNTIFVLLPRADRQAPGWVERLVTATVRVVAGALRDRVGCAYAPLLDAHDAIPQARIDIDAALRRQVSASGAAAVDVMRDRHVVQMQYLTEAGVAAEDRLIPQVTRVLEHDRVHRTSYALTLLTHLDCFGDVRRAAEELTVHENSHRYRMRKIVQAFGIDLDDPELRLILWLQLRIAVGRPGTRPLPR